MDIAALRAERLRSHRLTAPAATVGEAASHMLATQAQEFLGGRWALAVRTRRAPSLRAVDAAFDDGTLVRSWTQRGTIHVLPAEDLGWTLGLTGERQRRQAAGRRRGLGLDEDVLRRADREILAALRGGDRLTRAEMFDVLRGIGVDPREQRGVHVLYDLAVRGLVCMGPVVPRETGPTREQYVVATDDWIAGAASPADPLAELFTRYIDGHGPASPDDFAWWSGLPLGTARRAAEAAAQHPGIGRTGGDDDALFLARPRPRRAADAPDVLALPPFEEYFLSYADRTQSCPPEFVTTVAQGGMMRPIIVARGEVIGVWTHSLAVARHLDDPIPELLVPGAADDEEVAAALERYRAFIVG